MNDRLALAAVVGFLLGVGCASFVVIPWAGAGLMFLIAFVLLGAGHVTKRSVYLLVSVAFIGGALGVARTTFTPTTLPNAFVPLINTQATLQGTVVTDPDVRELNDRITVEVKKDGATTRVLAVAPLYPPVHIGDVLTVSGRLTTPAPFGSDGGRVFRYDRFLAKDGVFSMVTNAQIAVVGSVYNPILSAFGFFASVKHAFIGALEKALPEPAAGLAAGLLVGGKQGLGPALLMALTIAGLLQIVVLSGYNVMIVAEGILRTLSFLPKRLATLGACLGIVAFVLAAGAGSSAVRAGLMALIALYARATGRSYDALRALGAALVLMLLSNPLLLVYDPGLELSAVATLGLILASTQIEARLVWIKSLFVREIVATTLAAQLFVLPLLLWQTGNLSLVALPANILVMPVLPLAMLFSFLASLVAFVVPPLATTAGLPAYALLSYVMGVAKFAAGLPLAHVVIPAFPFWVVVLLYAGVAWLTYVIGNRRLPAAAGGSFVRSTLPFPETALPEQSN